MRPGRREKRRRRNKEGRGRLDSIKYITHWKEIVNIMPITVSDKNMLIKGKIQREKINVGKTLTSKIVEFHTSCHIQLISFLRVLCTLSP